VAIDPSGERDHESFETAIRHATTRVPLAAPAQRASEVLEALAGRSYECASHVVVCASGRFLGIATIEALLAAPAGVALESIMDREAPVVAPGIDQEIAAWHAVRKGESALSVVGSDGRFQGLIPPHRLLGVLLSEHEEDLSRAGGLLKGRLVAEAASQETVERRFVHRLPWLLLGLFGALAAADIVGWFERQLQLEVVLAFFIPGIVYLADAVGTQTETVVVRGLSVGVRMRSMVPRELLTGLAMGAALAACAAPLVWWRWGSADLAVTVGLSLFAACSLASVIAMALPWLFDAFGTDPAFGSGPLATVLQDLLSLLIYLGVAAAVVG
jgi:magnesium transporter